MLLPNDASRSCKKWGNLFQASAFWQLKFIYNLQKHSKTLLSPISTQPSALGAERHVCFDHLRRPCHDDDAAHLQDLPNRSKSEKLLQLRGFICPPYQGFWLQRMFLTHIFVSEDIPELSNSLILGSTVDLDKAH